jgi:glycosyltransferase involved in cell wall biosynthesis
MDEVLSSEGNSKESRMKVEILLPPRSPAVTFRNIKSRRVGRLNGHLWEQCELPRFARRGILLNPCGAAPLMHGKQVTTIHDAAVFDMPQGYSCRFRMWYSRALKHTALTSQAIFTVSEFSRSRLENVLGVPGNKIHVTYPGHEHVHAVEPGDSCVQGYEIEATKPFVLSIGSANPNKNFGLVLEAAKLARDCGLEWVVAGGQDPRVFSRQRSEAPGLRRLGYVTERMLSTLYRSCTCFVLPSKYEGFGLPVLEAVALGCPCVVARLPALQEMCGDAVLYCDPSDPASLLYQVNRIRRNERLREELKEKGLQRAKAFSWNLCGATALEVLSRL